MSLTHWVGRGTGTPKDKDEVNKQYGKPGLLFILI